MKSKSFSKVLLSNGANPDITNKDGKYPVDVATDDKIKSLFGKSNDVKVDSDDQVTEGRKFVPNYLEYPPVGYKVNLNQIKPTKTPDLVTKSENETAAPAKENMIDLGTKVKILKIRIADSNDKDFIEIDLPNTKFTFEDLTTVMCEELNIPKDSVERVRKLPNTKLRRDVEVVRLKDYEEIEIVLHEKK